MGKFGKMLGFDATEKQTSVRTELIAGVVTFLAMAYILTVNPNQIFGSTASPYWSSCAYRYGIILSLLLRPGTID